MDHSTDPEPIERHRFLKRKNKQPCLRRPTGLQHDDDETRAHEAQKPHHHVCDTCNRSFARPDHLERHERSHKAKPFGCTECTRFFARRDLLLRHQQQRHTINPSELQTSASNPESIVTPDDEEELACLDIKMKELSHSSEEQSQPVCEQGLQELNSVQVRGRTPERSPERSPSRSSESSDCFPYGRRSPGRSRATSSSSVRSMIDERLEWAHQDRMRSVSRSSPIQQSPFHEHSLYYAEYAEGKGLTPASRSRYVCECCPESPHVFNTEGKLRYALVYVATCRQCIANKS
jgi:hypothetical protein